MARRLLAALAIVVVAAALACGAEAQLSAGFYSSSCPAVHSIVRQAMSQAVTNNTRSAAAVLRVFFHDCFVNGCDGSVLLEASDRQAEKNAKPNLSLRGFDVIERIKQRLEAACALTVSCADIVAFAARDSVKLSGGLWYAVPGGRQDGTVSRASMTGDLPPPNQRNVDLLAQYFYRKGLTLDEMVLLSAAHTVGIAHCSSFDYRLTSDQDKGMDPAFRNSLRSQCQYNPSNYVPLDAGSQYAFDTGYFSNVLANRTVLDSDAALASPRTADKVKQWKNNPDWFKNSFAAAMVKMGSIRGSYPGKVRLNCTRVRM